MIRALDNLAHAAGIIISLCAGIAVAYFLGFSDRPVHWSSVLIGLLACDGIIVLGTALTALIPTVKDQAMPPTCCSQCGYDLRGSNEKIVVPCPECGFRNLRRPEPIHTSI